MVSLCFVIETKIKSSEKGGVSETKVPYANNGEILKLNSGQSEMV